ncbi:ABC transporter permease [Microbacterium sp. No. 7]|uniref:ABC transporter permease n=1 Tax=Microbacterium sp. No. 7 TaxID=1714373 RepID=UPI0006D0A6EB|nr:ABC transporter permease [Microbacterium sp. No. 7]
MIALLLRRLLFIVPTLIATSLIVFGLQTLIPGGPAQAIAGEGATPEMVAAIEKRLGLDQPLIVQYGSWIWGLLQGDLGTSYTSSVSVNDIVAVRLPVSFQLILMSIPLALVVGGALGIWAAIRAQRWDGKAVMSLSALGLSIPEFYLAALAAGIVGLQWRLLPPVGYVPITTSFWGNIETMILPTLVLAMPTAALICRHMRSSMVRELDSVHIRTAWAMGLRPREIYFNYALRIAVAPLITYVPLAIASLIGASVLVEGVFALPGLGSAIMTAVSTRDYGTLQGITILVAAIVIALNLVADIVLILIDPRLRVAGRRRGRRGGVAPEPVAAALPVVVREPSQESLLTVRSEA